MNAYNSDKLYSSLRQITSATDFWVAYSGGMDSRVLLHGLVELRRIHPEIKITAVHINHSLSANADLWTEHCRKVCAELNVNFVTQKIDVRVGITKKQSLEATARSLRYRALADLLPEGVTLLTAHHADDQA